MLLLLLLLFCCSCCYCCCYCYCFAVAVLAATAVAVVFVVILLADLFWRRVVAYCLVTGLLVDVTDDTRTPFIVLGILQDLGGIIGLTVAKRLNKTLSRAVDILRPMYTHRQTISTKIIINCYMFISFSSRISGLMTAAIHLLHLQCLFYGWGGVYSNLSELASTIRLLYVL